MADPTPYDILQDNQISALQDIVTPYYQPPEGPEHSFPIVGQGISAEQYRQTNLAIGNGILHRFPETYYLTGHATNSETNQRNTLILRVSRHNIENAVAEASISGFFHRMTEDMELSFSPVITATDVHVCLTYDPRKEEDPAGPISVEQYNNDLPTTHGREHLLLATVQMRPNQLLSEATILRYRQYASPLVYVPTQSTIPDPSQFPYGTTLITGTNGRGSILHHSSTAQGWSNPLVGEWQYPTILAPWEEYQFGKPAYRFELGDKVVLSGSLVGGPSGTSNSFFRVEPAYRPSHTVVLSRAGSGDSTGPDIRINSNGYVWANTANSAQNQWAFLDGLYYYIR